MTHVPLHARLRDLEEPERLALQDWYTNGLHAAGHHDRHGKVGLWVFGDRQHGSSYVAECATAKLVDRVGSWEHVDALVLTQNIRQHWNLSDMVRRNPEDYNLFLDFQELDTKLDFLWHECELLWVDDLHETAVDVFFFTRHVLPWLERRIKAKRVTIIATTLTPDDRALDGFHTVIKNLFVTCVAQVPVEDRRERVVRPYDDAAG